MMSVTIDPTEIRPPNQPVRRGPRRGLLLALPVGLSLAGLAGVCAVAMWPMERRPEAPSPVRAAAADIADWPEIKDGVPDLVSPSTRVPGQATASAVSRALADARPSPGPIQPAPVLDRPRPFVPVDSGAGPVSPAPFEPATPLAQVSPPPPAEPVQDVPAPPATPVQASADPVPAASADPMPAPPAVSIRADLAPPAPPVAAPTAPQEGSASAADAVVVEAASPTASGLRGAVPAARRENAPDVAAPPSRAAAAKKAKADARRERAEAARRDGASPGKPAAKKPEKVAAPARKPEPAKTAGAVAQAGAVASAASGGDPAKPAADEDRVRVFGMSLPAFVPTGRKIKETVGNLGDAVMSLPEKF